MSPEHNLDLDLFAGPGGWDVAAHRLGLDPYGVEWNEDACATATAAGFARLCSDVAALDPLAVARDRKVGGLIASPPCQAFSMAGHGHGRAGAQVLLEGVLRIGLGEDAVAVSKDVDAELHDERAALVLEPLRWALDLEPTWLAFEQVPPVLPLWQAMARVLGRQGWHVATGVLSAEQYGVPQTRRRAFLIANRDVDVRLPPPVHRAYVKGVGQREGDPNLLPWLSMADVLGHEREGEVSLRSNYSSSLPGAPRYGQTAEERGRTTRQLDEPATTMSGRPPSWQLTSGTRARASIRRADQPATAMAFGHDAASYAFTGADVELEDLPAAKLDGRAVRISVREAGMLQGFPADHPWRGTKSAQYQQVGDAVPPPLAEHVLRAAMGLVPSDGLW